MSQLDSIGVTFAQGEAGLSIFDLAVKGGIMMIPIGICSLIVVAVVAERASVLRASRVLPQGFEKRFKKALGSADATGVARAREACKKSNSPAGRVLVAGLDALEHGPEVVEKHLAAAGESEVYAMRARLRTLTVIAAVTPLMGLTGTIFGMIRAFQTVASSGESLGKAELLAGGIYEAMITTAAGLLVAMPTVIFYHWLASRVERLTRELDRLAVLLIERCLLRGPGTTAPGEQSVGETLIEGKPKGDAVTENGVAEESADTETVPPTGEAATP